mgnify:CR=1 FL=1
MSTWATPLRGEEAASHPDADTTNLRTASFSRVVLGCALLLFILSPALMIAGTVLLLTPNPQDDQRAELSAAASRFQLLAPILQATTAVIVTTTDDRKLGTLRPAYETLPVVVTQDISGSTGTTIILSTVEARVPLEENIGPGLGALNLQITHQGQTSPTTTPPITLTRAAKRPVMCVPQYASICGTSTCCSLSDMQDQCNTIARQFSKTATSFVPTSVTCGLGDECGHCTYNQYASRVCFVFSYNSILGFAIERSKGSCLFPFTPVDQEYADADVGAQVVLRSKDDAVMVFARMTSGTMLFTDDRGSERARGRGLLVFGVLCLVTFVALLVVVRASGQNPLSVDFWKSALVGDEDTHRGEKGATPGPNEWGSHSPASQRGRRQRGDGGDRGGLNRDEEDEDHDDREGVTITTARPALSHRSPDPGGRSGRRIGTGAPPDPWQPHDSPSYGDDRSPHRPPGNHPHGPPPGDPRGPPTRMPAPHDDGPYGGAEIGSVDGGRFAESRRNGGWAPSPGAIASPPPWFRDAGWFGASPGRDPSAAPRYHFPVAAASGGSTHRGAGGRGSGAAVSPQWTMDDDL